ncbi:uncharacterized protein PFL1_03132 [Pseudozyma flocculosa PF-1]|uniref:Related to Muskelin n=2 Tax=Pseudozyma flocculosa TaxID=84751 RepID=A0A5C3F1Z2_9BASI|nr:uncharacterized protein PFL1_03132 [Pseudozyma flocculosa PF-1]EPQ29377.1 hypothetical protein PFL1_03132 [Pseudozyma flocculosa PF-1]SPO37896.1 related to Muskelin [Pseudozyma flocculosa]
MSSQSQTPSLDPQRAAAMFDDEPALDEKARPPTLLQQLLDARPTTLRYSIACASSYSGTYHPNNILYNRPHDMSSRWSGSSQATQAAAAAQGANAARTAAPAASSTTTSSSSPRRAPAASSPAAGPIIATPSQSASSKQYIILRLDKPCVVRSITFGKYHKPHPCNLRDFKIYGSLSLDSLLPAPASKVGTRAAPAAKRLIRGGLRNDAAPEKFELRWLEDVSAGSGSGAGDASAHLGPGQGELDRRGLSLVVANSGNVIPFALRYIKIVPLAAHTPNYNFSVWHVALAGVSNDALVSRVLSEYSEYRESATIRLMLKHLREQGHHTAFAALLQSSRLQGGAVGGGGGELAPTHPAKRPFEHPIVTRLFDSLVRRGSWDEVEGCLDKAAYGDPSTSNAQFGSTSIQSLAGSASWESANGQSMFSAYIAKQMPRADWQRILPTDPAAAAQQQHQQEPRPSAPSGRGGHSMVFDSEKGIAYLFGGWDGFQDLCDLWAFHVHENRWRLISPDVRLQGGPGPRSCHKMCLDEKSGSIYVLGRYIDYESSGASRQREGPFPGSPSATIAAAAAAASAARSTRASFLPPVPPSRTPPTGDVPMGQPDAGSQSGEGDRTTTAGSGSGTGENGGSGRHRRLDQLGADPEGQSRSSTPASTSGPQSPGRPPRNPAPGRASSRNPNGPASPPGREPDFFRFSTKWERWEKLSSDTYADGGPKLVYDHGLVVDSQSQILYVFGGRIADPDPNRFEFSGMWRYDIIQRVWTFLFDDTTQSGCKIVSRSGHSMLLDPGKPGTSGMSASQSRQIWILGGHRGASATNLADMWTYNIATGAVREISTNTGQDGPESGFTQRATIDPAAREISLFVGLIGGRGDKKKTSAFWIYNITWGTWKQVYRYEAGYEAGDEAARTLELGAAKGAGSGDVEQRTGDRFGEQRSHEADYDGEEPPESGPLQALPVYDDDDADVEDDEMAIEGPADSWMPYSLPSSSSSSAAAPMPQLLATTSSGSQTPTSPSVAAAAAGHRQSARGAGHETEPRPRYAAQLVFDDRRKVFYLHGGNPEDADNRQLRLDDMWRLTLMRPTPGEVLRRAKFRVRQQRFLEMTRSIAAAQAADTSGGGGADPTALGFEALIYLQTEVGAVVDHSNEAESQLFRRLMTRLLSAKAGGGTAATSMADVDVETGDVEIEADRTLTGDAAQHDVDPATGVGSAGGAADAAPPRTDRLASMGAKRGRDEVETEDEEAARSPISLYASSAGGDGDSEMLSISQVLPGGGGGSSSSSGGAGGGTGGRARKTMHGGRGGSANDEAATVRVAESEGTPTGLYAERTHLFRSLLEYFNPELTQPRAEIGHCIEAALGA